MYQIYNLRFPSPYLMSSTLMRVSEFYESPRFRGQVFTHEECMDWYAHTRGSMSYFTDWGGFNIPSRVISEFSTLFHPLSEKERKLINLLRRNVTDPYYLIATCDKDKTILLHEIIHGLYSLYPKYAMDVNLILGEVDLGSQHLALLKLGYSQPVLDDEINAYTVTGIPKELSKKKLNLVRGKLLKLVEKHFFVKLDTIQGKKGLLSKIHNLDWGVGEPVKRP